MMRRRLYAFLAVLPVLFGCTGEALDDAQETTAGIRLDVWCNYPPESSKAGTSGILAGDDNYNENLIEAVDFFFFPGSSPSGAATWHIRKTSGRKGYDVFLIDEVDAETINTKIFPSLPVDTRTATVFAVANYPGTLVVDEADLSPYTMEYLQSLKVDTDFVTPSKQDSFMMGGSTLLLLRGRNQVMAAVGSIHLERYAAKLTVAVKVEESVTLDNSEVWYPMLDQMEVYLVEAVKTVNLAGLDPEPLYFSYSGNRRRFDTPPVDGYYNTTPMYMYPQTWTYGATTGYDREPYIKLVMPWRRGAENGFSGIQKQFYYKIVIPDDIRGEEYFRRFTRNTHYHLNIDVGILGAETDESAIPITPCSCYIVYWQDKEVVIKQAEIGTARYLSVEKESYILHNVPDQTIRYVSSHSAVIKEGSIRVTRPYYGESSAGSEVLGGTVRTAASGDIYEKGTLYLDYSLSQRMALNGGEDWLSNTGDAIEFHHDLNNDYSSVTFDYSPYTVSFTIVHEDRPDDARYTRNITLVQRPAVPQGIHPFGHCVHWRIIGFTGGSRNIFKISATVLPSGTDFVIGDPRTDVVDNLGKEFHEFEDVDGNTRSLTHYYPTENSDRTRNMMAPSYRIASKHGGVEFGGISKERARYRCATYQEDGFPSGRWRLPTSGEIRFMAMLSSNKAFTFLFTTGSTYWSANGAITVGSGGTVTESSSSTALARCVYDTWYWGDEQQDDRNKPVWGDLLR